VPDRQSRSANGTEGTSRANPPREHLEVPEPVGLPEPPPEGQGLLAPGSFSGVTAVVTGGGTGLGKAIASELGRLGADVVIASRNPEHLEAGVAAVEAAGGRAAGIRCDIRDADSVASMFDEAEGLSANGRRAEGRGEQGLGEQGQGAPVTVLVNNAAANFPVAAEEMSPNAWRSVVDTTLNGTFLCSRELARRLLPRGVPGSIVNVGASYAWTGGPGFAHSAAAKAGVVSLTRSLAVEWGPYGIQVNAVVPGLFPHEDMTDDIQANLARSERLANLQPALRVGKPRELAWAVSYLASPYARFVTGQVLVVDGGNWLRRTLTSQPVVPVREQLGLG